MPDQLAGDPGPAKETPVLTPTPKVAAAGTAGAASIVLVYILALLGLEVPGEVASALTTLIAFGAAYLKTD